MENKNILRTTLPITLLFVLINGLIILSRPTLEAKGFDIIVLAAGNFLLFLVSIISFILYQRGLKHATTQGFLRNTYGGTLLKLMVCLFAALIYFMVSNSINKPSLFACMGIYLIYSFFEMRSVLQINKQQKKNV